MCVHLCVHVSPRVSTHMNLSLPPPTHTHSRMAPLHSGRFSIAPARHTRTHTRARAHAHTQHLWGPLVYCCVPGEALKPQTALKPLSQKPLSNHCLKPLSHAHTHKPPAGPPVHRALLWQVLHRRQRQPQHGARRVSVWYWVMGCAWVCGSLCHGDRPSPSCSHNNEQPQHIAPPSPTTHTEH